MNTDRRAANLPQLIRYLYDVCTLYQKFVCTKTMLELVPRLTSLY